jgi:hypothetical protein
MPTFANFDAEKKTPMANSVALQTLPQRLTPSLPPLNGVTAVVSRCSPSVASLQHVLCLISDFLDFSGSWAIPRACARLGCLPLLRRLLQREKSANSPLDPYYRDWIFNRGVSKAAKGGDLDVVKWLMTEYSPRTVVTLGVEAAAAGGHLHVLEWLYECDVEHGTALFGQREMLFAAREGHLDVLQWLYEKDRVSSALGIDFSAPAMSMKCSVECLQAAADNGHLKVVLWLTNQIDQVFPSLPADWNATRAHPWGLLKRARRDHLEVLEYFAAQKFAWLEMTPSAFYMYYAARKGRFHVVKWLHSEGYFIQDVQFDVMGAAAARGHLQMLQWMHETGSFGVEKDLFVNAARSGRLEVVQFIHEHFSEERIFTKRAMDVAAERGHLDIVQWLHETRSEGCTTAAMDKAAGNGHLEVVQWLHANRVEGCTLAAMNDSAANGHLDVIQWLHANRSEGCSEAAMDSAAGKGNLQVLHWLHANRSEGCTTNAMDHAAQSGHLEIIKWLHAHRNEGCTASAMDEAAGNGHLHVIEWLHLNRSEGCTTRAMDSAAKRGHLEVVQWLHSNRAEGCSTCAMDDAARRCHFEVMVFLHENRSEGCSSGVFEKAILSNDLDILRWLAARYPQHVDPTISFHIFQGLHVESKFGVMRWLFQARDQAGVSPIQPRRSHLGANGGRIASRGRIAGRGQIADRGRGRMRAGRLAIGRTI